MFITEFRTHPIDKIYYGILLILVLDLTQIVYNRWADGPTDNRVFVII